MLEIKPVDKNDIYRIIGWSECEKDNSCHVCDERGIAVRQILEHFDLIKKDV